MPRLFFLTARLFPGEENQAKTLTTKSVEGPSLPLKRINNTYNIKRCYYKFFLKYISPKTNIIIKIEKPNNTMFAKFLIFFCNASICKFKSITIIDSLVTEEGLET